MREVNFKHTEIGLIPHDWEVKSIADVAQTSSGGTPSRSVPSYYEGSIRWFTTGELCDGLLIDSLEHITPEALSSSSAKLFKEGTLLMAMYGATIGKLGILSKPSTTNQACCAIMCNDIPTKYLFFQLLFHRESIIAMGRGAGQPNISQDIVKRLQLPLPPTLAEQERIAGALSSIDTLIGALNEQIEKKRHIKQGTMQQLLTGKKRLAGFTGEWIEKSIDELGDLTGAGVDKTSKEDEIPVRLVNYLDVFHRDTIYNRELNFWVTANETKLQQCNVKCGDVFFTPSSEMPYDIALSAVAMEDMRNVCYSYHIYRLRLKENIDLNYRAYMFKAASFYEQANTTCEGSGKRYVISLTKFKKLSVYYPVDIAEQSAIAVVLSRMDTEIAALEQKRDKYIAIKSGMMQDLLTGKIRLV